MSISAFVAVNNRTFGLLTLIIILDYLVVVRAILLLDRHLITVGEDLRQLSYIVARQSSPQ